MKELKYIYQGREITIAEAMKLELEAHASRTDENRIIQYRSLTQELFADGLIEIRVTPDNSVLCIDTRTQTAIWYLEGNKNSNDDAH